LAAKRLALSAHIVVSIFSNFPILLAAPILDPKKSRTVPVPPAQAFRPDAYGLLILSGAQYSEDQLGIWARTDFVGSFLALVLLLGSLIFQLDISST
jgi:hypothetical protein